MTTLERVRAWLQAPVPTKGLGTRLREDRASREEGLRTASARLGISAWQALRVETSTAGKSLRDRVDAALSPSPTEPRWRQVAALAAIVAMALTNAFAIVGYCARWTGWRGVVVKAGVAVVLWAAAFLLWKGWHETRPGGEYDGMEAFLYMRMQNALSFGLLAALVAGWVTHAAVNSPRPAKCAVVGAAAALALFVSMAPLRIVNRDATHRRDVIATANADFRRETTWARQKARLDPSFDDAEAKRAAAVKMLKVTELPVATWMKDKRAYRLHKSIVTACLEAVERGDLQPEECIPKEDSSEPDIDRWNTFTYLFRSQF